ncbi:hypothetical protein FACHB389_13115 [Nostoc calcicola FACHB-389]|nr:hypothetical protein FACHB389_13115 [Nostoc calcicola FACHB-389]
MNRVSTTNNQLFVETAIYRVSCLLGKGFKILVVAFIHHQNFLIWRPIPNLLFQNYLEGI